MTWSARLGREARDMVVELREREGRSAGHPACPKCGGAMWDNRADKRNPRAPDFRCRKRDCNGRLWPGQAQAGTASEEGEGHEVHETPSDSGRSRDDERGPLADSVDAVMHAAGASDARMRARAGLRACYLDVTEFVLAEVRPRYAAAGAPCSDATAAAIAATLFIATCDRGAIGSGPDMTDAACGEG